MIRPYFYISNVLFLLLLVFSASLSMAQEWDTVGIFDEVKVSRKTVEGSPLFAFRGITEADISLDVLIGTFTDPKERKYWVDRYHQHETFQKTELSETYWIRFKLPPLVSDRDYVLQSNATIDKEKGVVEVKIKSVTNDKYPPDCCVRAEVKSTYYKFTALSSTRTKLEVEVHTDPKGLLPNYLVNLIQKKWPSKTLSRLIKHSLKQNKSHVGTKEWLDQKFPKP